MINVLLVDDHNLVRQGLCQIVAENDDMEVFGEAADGYQLLDLLQDKHPDIIIMDIAMPRLDGMDTLDRLRDLAPDVPVLILTTFPTEQFAIQVFKAGASGYLTKESAADELIAAIRQIVSGRNYVSNEVAEVLSRNMNARGRIHEAKDLSRREKQVIMHMGHGRTGPEIAGILHISVKTVQTYQARIMEKTGARNAREIVRYAILNKLVD